MDYVKGRWDRWIVKAWGLSHFAKLRSELTLDNNARWGERKGWIKQESSARDGYIVFGKVVLYCVISLWFSRLTVFLRAAPRAAPHYCSCFALLDLEWYQFLDHISFLFVDFAASGPLSELLVKGGIVLGRSWVDWKSLERGFQIKVRCIVWIECLEQWNMIGNPPLYIHALHDLQRWFSSSLLRNEWAGIDFWCRKLGHGLLINSL